MFQKRNQSKPKWRGQPSAMDKKEAWQELQKLKDRQRFLCNPHFLPPNAQHGGMSLIRPKVAKAEHKRKGAEEQRYLECADLSFCRRATTINRQGSDTVDHMHIMYML